MSRWSSRSTTSRQTSQRPILRYEFVNFFQDPQNNNNTNLQTTCEANGYNFVSYRNGAWVFTVEAPADAPVPQVWNGRCYFGSSREQKTVQQPSGEHCCTEPTLVDDLTIKKTTQKKTGMIPAPPSRNAALVFESMPARRIRWGPRKQYRLRKAD